MRPTKQDRTEAERAGEPAEIRDLSNKQLYDLLATEYYLPPFNSRGVNRRYLVGVYLGHHFRVPAPTIHHFEADLTANQKVKAPVLFCSQVMAKTNSLLAETGQRSLGFDPGMVPEEKWLVDIVRYVDRGNLLGVFLEAIPGAPQLGCLSERMITAKANAERYLLLEPRLLENAALYKQIVALHDHSKRLDGHRKELLALVEKGRNLERMVAEADADVKDRLCKISLCVFNHGNRNDDTNIIFMEENDGPRLREQVGQIREM